MFRIMEGKGFHIEFPTGVLISTQIGPGNYCSNYDKNIVEHYKMEVHKCRLESEDAEIAIITGNGYFITKYCPDLDSLEQMVAGNVDLLGWIKAMTWAASLTVPQIKTMELLIDPDTVLR